MDNLEIVSCFSLKTCCDSSFWAGGGDINCRVALLECICLYRKLFSSEGEKPW